MKNKNFNDWAVALAVIACSILLFLALAFALSGTIAGKAFARLARQFSRCHRHEPWLAGQIRRSNRGKGVRHPDALPPKERTDSGDPLNAVQVILALNSGVPPLPSDTSASIAADTLLSDKFILLSGGSAKIAAACGRRRPAGHFANHL